MSTDRFERHDERCRKCCGAGVLLLRRGGPAGSAAGDLVDCECRSSEIRAKHVVLSGMDHKREVTFANLPPYTWQANQWAAAREYCASPVGWLWMHGGYYTGKSSLAYCMANAWLEAGKRVVSRVVPRLLDELRDTYSNDDRTTFKGIFDTICQVPYLVLDDYGKQNDSLWAVEKLFDLTDFRIEHRLPTIVTSNLTMQELEARNPRLFYRVNDLANMIVVPFPTRKPNESRQMLPQDGPQREHDAL